MPEQKRKKYVIPFRATLKWIVRLRRSPRSIAGGFALGTLVAFTPTIGIQIVVVVFLATVLNLNRPAAVVMTWITNVATMAPIYTFNYWVGSLLWPGPSVGEVSQVFMDLAAKLVSMDVLDMLEQFKAVTALSREIIAPLVLGSVVVGLCAALVVYSLSLALIRFLAEKRNARRKLG